MSNTAEDTSLVRDFGATMQRLREITQECGASRVGTAATTADIARHNAGADLLEACMAMEMLFERFLETRDLDERATQRYEHRNAEYGADEWEVEITDEAELRELQRSSHLRGEMAPLIRVIYHYCYPIHEALREAGVQVSAHVLAELGRVQAYRSKAVAHHGGRVAETRHGSLAGGLRFHLSGGRAGLRGR